MDEKEAQSTGLRLLKKGHKGLLRCIFGRLGLVMVLLLVQMVYLLAVFLWCEDYMPHVFGGHTIVAVIMVLYLINYRLDPMAKITWLVIIIPFPVFGTMLFLFIQSELGQRTMRGRLKRIREESQAALVQDAAVMAEFEKVAPGPAAMARYVAKSGCYPVFAGNQVTYFPLGQDKFRQLLVELEQAEKYIYLEYFIVDEGLMWGKVLEILARKAAQGVDVRLMYDGTCEFTLLPRNYPKRLQKLGIQCKVFSRATPLVSTHYNYRDHRKILVIDGHTAFTGGVNLADEYINHICKFGYWKDTAVMIKGDAARSFTLMFLQLWGLSEKQLEPLPAALPVVSSEPSGGFVLPYSDDPMDGEKVGKRVYMDLLARAERYVHIMTPYLILDSELENALCYAAKRGVDVRLLLPGIPDKKIPYALAKTHYRALLDAGVKIYEYIPGFVHAKVFVCDDREAVVGTINLDYRSLYHHFECASYLYGVPCIAEIEADFQACLTVSRTVTYETVKKEKWHVKLIGFVVKLLAPLM